MKSTKQVRWIIFFFVLLFLGYETSVFGIENYTLKPLFELKTGRGIDEFLLAFAPAPFAPVEGKKTPLSSTGTHVLVDNSGNFYLLKERTNIVKIGPKGEVIKEIRGSKPFTVPMRMRLDGEDNLYVMFSNDTNIAEEFRYAVAKFNKQGELLHWIADEEGFKCIFLSVHVNGTVFLQSCAFGDAARYNNQLQRYDSAGRFIGLFTHRGITHRETVDTERGLHVMSIGHILAVGADGHVYVVNDHDYTVKKYIDQDGSLTTTEGVKPAAERAVFPWQTAKYAFQGFDVNNKMYFYHSPDGRIRKRVELPKYLIDVLDLSRRLELECFRYEFDQDRYDTLKCESVIQKEGEFATRWPLRNYISELYEVVIFFNDPPNVTPQDHVKFYKWERVE